MTTPSVPFIFDRDRVRRNRDRAAKNYQAYAFLKERVSRDILERLDDTPHQFEHGIELGAADGALSAMLKDSSKVQHIIATDISEKMLSQATARGLETAIIDEEHLSFEDHQFDLVLSALSLHWVNDLPGTLIQIRRKLKPDGLFIAALPGGATLMELRTCLMEAEAELKGRVAPRVSPLPSLADMAGLLQRAGFALPVADKEHLTIRYDSLFDLAKDLKGMGERAAFHSGIEPVGRDVILKAAEIYAERFADPDGRIRATVELVWLSGWAPAPNQPKPKRPGSAKASLAAAIGAIEKSAGEKAQN